MTVDLGLAFQARHLAVPMSIAERVGHDEPSRIARERLERARYDQAPVVRDGQVVGFVLTRRLDAASEVPVDRVMTRLGEGTMVSADASIGQLLGWILEPGMLFVLEGREITGFVTVSDFNKQPARGYLYLLLARFETGLADLLRHRFADDLERAVTLLPAGDQEVIFDRYRADVEADEEGDLIAYFDLSDLVKVVARDEQLRASLDVPSRARWERWTGGLVALRNEVMHPVRNVVLAKEGLEKLHEREQRTRELIERVERAVSDRRP